MRLPKPEPLFDADWPYSVNVSWESLISSAAESEGKAGTGDLYQRMVAIIRASMNRSGALPAEVYETRAGARALTALWLTEARVRERFLGRYSLERLWRGQEDRLSRLSLGNLILAYFTVYDRLDYRQDGLARYMADLLKHQVRSMMRSDSQTRSDMISLCAREDWLFGESAPRAFVDFCNDSGLALIDFARKLGIESIFNGRFGSICRAIYYLDQLKAVPVGQYHEVFDELLNPDVYNAPYEQGLTIGHAALKIIIDRTEGDPTNAWQNFVLAIAGDPRVGSRAKSFIEWWVPLNKSRIQKVRGWLAREDLRLFLRAVEEYGKESGDLELQKMFPARQRFLEGLHEQGLVRNTRLMLGNTAQWHIKRILGKDMLSAYSTLKGMPDKAIIYMDCGDFHLIEGSHMFKIWIYFACPDPILLDYSQREFSHAGLTSRIPASYKREYPGLPYSGFTHYPKRWRHEVLQFIADQGISLEWHRLFSHREWEEYKNRFGIPVVKTGSRW